MLNRRILRIKAFKIIYSYAVTGGKNLDDILKGLDKSCEATRDLWLFLLAIIPPVTEEAKRRIEARKGKFNPTEEDLNPNMKFAQNKVAGILADDPDFKKVLSRKNLSWEQYDVIVRSVYSSFSARKCFADYMADPETSLKADCDLFIKMFEKEFIGKPQIDELLEDINIDWMSDDLEYAIHWVIFTLRDLSEGKRWNMVPLYQSDVTRLRNPGTNVSSDRDFVRKICGQAYSGYQRYFKEISEAVPDWDSDRLFSMDMAILALALAEAESVPDIPLKVTVNEWVEISKFFCSEKSPAFINGLLDTMIQKEIADGKIKKNF